MFAINIDRSVIKIGILIETAIFMAAFFGYELAAFITNLKLSNFVLLMVAAVLWLALLVLHSLVIKSFRLTVTSVILQAAVLWILQADRFSTYTLVGVLILFFCLYLGVRRGRLEVDDSLKIKFFRIGSRTVGIVMTGIAVFLALHLIGKLNPETLSFSRNSFEIFLKGADPLVSQIIPGFSVNLSVKEAIKIYARTKVPADTGEKTLDDLADQVRGTLSQATGTNIKATDRVSDALYAVTVSKLESLPSAFRSLILVALGVLIFSSVKGLTFFLNWAIIGLAFVIYHLLLAFNFMYLTYDKVEKEIIIVK